MSFDGFSQLSLRLRARVLILAVTEVNMKSSCHKTVCFDFTNYLSGLEDNFLSNKVGQRIKYEFKTFLRCRRYLHRKQEVRINFIWKRHSIYLNGSTPGHSLALWRMDGSLPETITWLQWRSFKDKDQLSVDSLHKKTIYFFIWLSLTFKLASKSA